MPSLLSEAVNLIEKAGSRAFSGADRVSTNTFIKDGVFSSVMHRANPTRSPRGTGRLGKGAGAIADWTGTAAHRTPTLTPTSYSGPSRAPQLLPKQNWTRSGNSTPGAWKWDESQRGQMVHVPSATPSAAPKTSASTRPIKDVASTGKPFNWAGSLGSGAVAGGFMANFMAAPEDRGFGTFVKGATFGAVGGTGMNYLLGSGAMSRAARSAMKFTREQGLDSGRSWAAGAYKMAKMGESQQSRAMAFGAGAMLAGGLAGSGRSKAHGINGNRGNRFGG